jgi:hypothetical protein
MATHIESIRIPQDLMLQESSLSLPFVLNHIYPVAVYAMQVSACTVRQTYLHGVSDAASCRETPRTASPRAVQQSMTRSQRAGRLVASVRPRSKRVSPCGIAPVALLLQNMLNLCLYYTRISICISGSVKQPSFELEREWRLRGGWNHVHTYPELDRQGHYVLAMSDWPLFA